MAQRKHKRPAERISSKPPPSPEQAKWKEFKRLAQMQEREYKKVAGDNRVTERNILVSREIVKKFPFIIETAEDMVEFLAAKALGLMQLTRAADRAEFLRNVTGRMPGMLNRHKIPQLFVDADAGGAAQAQEVVAATVIQSFRERVEELFAEYVLLTYNDATKKEEQDYYELYWVPISEDKIPRAVIYARMMDLAVQTDVKLDVLEAGSEPYYQDWQRMALFKTMRKVYEKIADIVGLGASTAIQIRRGATDLMDMHFKQHGERGTGGEDFELYNDCKELHATLEPAAKEFASVLVEGGELENIIAAVEPKAERIIGLDIRVRLASHTSNEDEVCRVKGPAGMFWKVKKKRERGEPDYSLEDIADFLGVTFTVNGDLDDARMVADWIRVYLQHNRQRLKINKIEMDPKKESKRDTGYEATHIDFEVKVGDVLVPCEIQVRTEEIHEAAKTGEFSHALKEVGMEHKEHKMMMRKVVDVLRPDFHTSATINRTKKQSLAAKAKRAAKRASASTCMVQAIYLVPKKEGMVKENKRYSVEVMAGEAVWETIIHTTGFKNAVKVIDKEGEVLDLFDLCPPDEIFVEVDKSKNGPDRNTCNMLLERGAVNKKAIRKIREHMASFPKRPRRGGKKK